LEFLVGTGDISEFPLENAEIADCLADDAVRRELLSGSNSLIIRDNTGNFSDFGRLGAELGPDKLCLLSRFDRNSLLNRTGNYFGGTGNFFDVTGNFQGDQGNSYSGSAGRRNSVFSAWMEF
jgi:hypothetical protein